MTKLRTYNLRSRTKKAAKQLARYALKKPKITSLKTKKRGSKWFFGIYSVRAEGMKRDSEGKPLKGTHFVWRP